MKFDAKKLAPELQSIIRSGNTTEYAISAAIEQWIVNHSPADVNTLLCWAHYEWRCASLTDFEEDIIDFGGAMLSILSRVLETDPENEEALKYRLKISKKIKKATKDRDAILKYEKSDLAEMSMPVIQELAFYYFCRATLKKEYAGKAYRYYRKLYEEEMLKPEPSRERVYYLSSMAYGNYFSEGYESTQPLIEQLLAWDLSGPYDIYDFKITSAFWMKLKHHADCDDLPGFKATFESWIAKLKAAVPQQAPYTTDTALLNPVAKWLLTKENTNAFLNYMLKECYGFLSKSALTNEDKAIMFEIGIAIKKG